MFCERVFWLRCSRPTPTEVGRLSEYEGLPPPDRQLMVSKCKVACYRSNRLFAYEWSNMLAISVLHRR